MKQFLKKNYLLIIMFAVIFNVMAVGVTLAYFTSRPDTVTNSFSAGNVTIEVKEPNWDPIGSKTIAPNQEIDKDPSITNTGHFDAYVFMKVEVERASVITVGADKVTLSKREPTDLFIFNWNDGWELISEEHADDVSTYIFAYTKGILKVGATTDTPIFNKVKMANVLEGELSTTTKYYVNATGLAVQSDSLEMEGDTMLDKLKYAYETYLKG